MAQPDDSPLNLYPLSRDDFLALQTMRGEHWTPHYRLHRFIESYEHKEFRQTYEDETYDVFYTVTESIFTGASDPMQFLQKENRLAEIEYACYDITPRLGFAVPGKVVQSNEMLENVPSPLDRAGRSMFWSVLTTQKIEGDTIEKILLQDKDMPAEERKELVTDWILQAIPLGALTRNKEQMIMHNCIRKKTSEPEDKTPQEGIKKNKLVFFDFEDARFYDETDIAHKILFAGLMYYRDYVDEPLKRSMIMQCLEETSLGLQEQKGQVSNDVFNHFTQNMRVSTAEMLRLCQTYGIE